MTESLTSSLDRQFGFFLNTIVEVVILSIHSGSKYCSYCKCCKDLWLPFLHLLPYMYLHVLIKINKIIQQQQHSYYSTFLSSPFFMVSKQFSNERTIHPTAMASKSTTQTSIFASSIINQYNSANLISIKQLLNSHWNLHPQTTFPGEPNSIASCLVMIYWDISMRPRLVLNLLSLRTTPAYKTPLILFGKYRINLFCMPFLLLYPRPLFLLYLLQQLLVVPGIVL